MVDDESVIDVDVMKIDELKRELWKLQLRCSGNKAELHEWWIEALRCKEGNKDGAEEDEGSATSEDDEYENANGEQKTRNQERRFMQQPLSFKDVENSVRPFSSDDGQNVRKWQKDFEETAEICRWSASQQIIYAKKVLRRSAKVFVSDEKRLTTWTKVKRSLISEFGGTMDSKKVHHKLARARKKDSESYQKYTRRATKFPYFTHGWG